MSSAPLLSDYSGQISPQQERKRALFEANVRRTKEYNELKNSADTRKVATKVMGAVCCPISTSCGIFLGTVGCLCCYCRPLYFCVGEQNQNGIPYCPYTTCESPCWAVPLPKKRADMFKRIFDMCILCICCSDDRPENYLLPEERQRYETLRPVARRQALEEFTPFPTELTEMVLSFQPRDIPPPQEYRTPIPSPFTSSDSGRVSNRAEWWMP